jgi:hypothetical protein
MFCPQCRTEYRRGFHKCADCEVTLVSELPPEEPEQREQELEDDVLTPADFNPEDYSLLKQVNSHTEAILAQGLLEGAGIDAHVLSDEGGTISRRLAASFSSYSVYVNKKDVRLAEELLNAPHESSEPLTRGNNAEKENKYLTYARIVLVGVPALLFLLIGMPAKPAADPNLLQEMAVGIAILFLSLFIVSFIVGKDR